MKNKNFRLFLITLCFCWLAACASEKWNGETYSGEITINGVQPDDKPVEKFTLRTAKMPDGAKKFVKFDAANKVLADCEIPIDDKYASGGSEGRFVFVLDSTVCTSTVNNEKAKIEIHSGDITVDENSATVSGVGVVKARSYTFEIKAKP